MKICFETSQKQIFSWFPPPLLPSSPLFSPRLPSTPLVSPLLPLSPLFSPCLPSTPLVSPLLPFQQVVEEMQPLVLSSFSSVPLLRSYPHSAQLRALIVAQQQQEETALEHVRRVVGECLLAHSVGTVSPSESTQKPSLLLSRLKSPEGAAGGTATGGGGNSIGACEASGGGDAAAEAAARWHGEGWELGEGWGDGEDGEGWEYGA
ncbi:unnamed protein product [Closterium sp. NIES-65]|nr:unnamed protein product [Closterium sp. NIES-65]